VYLAEAVAHAVEDIQIDDADLAMRRLTKRSEIVASLIADEVLICIGVLIGDLSLPMACGKRSLILETQTGLRKTNGLSALTRRRERESNADDADEAENPACAA